MADPLYGEGTGCGGDLRKGPADFFFFRCAVGSCRHGAGGVRSELSASEYSKKRVVEGQLVEV